MIAEYPFLLALAAAAIADASAILLRYVSSQMGRWAWRLALVLSVLSAVSWIWSLVWAIQSSLTPLYVQRPWRGYLGAMLIFSGASVAGWSIAALGWRTFGAAPPAPLVTSAPYRYLRRPMALGAMIFTVGLAAILHAGAMNVWCAVWIIVAQLLLELEEWELGNRLSGAQGYLETTARYLPWITKGL